jgi:hypothetical protein
MDIPPPTARTAPASSWFAEEPDDPDDPLFETNPLPLDDHEYAFLNELRERAAAWPANGAASFSCRFKNDPRTLAAVMVVYHSNPSELRCWSDSQLFTIGVHRNREEIRGGDLDDQLFHLLDGGSFELAPITLSGDLEATVDRVAAWFEAILRRPVERLEWWHRERPYAFQYRLADTREGLINAYHRGLAPREQCRLLVEAGSYHGRGWIQPEGIGAPDVARRVCENGINLPVPGLSLPD